MVAEAPLPCDGEAGTGAQHGHGPPGVNDIPHIDAHFNLITMAEREAITCDGETAPDDGKVPSGVEVNVNKEPFGGCVPAMGGHGALVIGLRAPDRWRSISALAPIVAPSRVPWGHKAFSGYLGDDRAARESLDELFDLVRLAMP